MLKFPSFFPRRKDYRSGKGNLVFSGRSAAWLARLVRDQEVGGSNPLAPTIEEKEGSGQGPRAFFSRCSRQGGGAR